MTLGEKVSQLVSEKSREERFSGVVIIQQEGETILEAVHGYANRSWKVKNRIDTRFRIGSISKMFTAVAALQMIEENMFTLNINDKRFGMGRCNIRPMIHNGVFIWAIPKHIRDQLAPELTPEMEKELRAIGYLH